MSTVRVERARERSGPGADSAPLFDVHAADGSRLYSVVVGEPTTRTARRRCCSSLTTSSTTPPPGNDGSRRHCGECR